MSHYDQESAGRMISRITNDVESLNTLVSGGLNQLVSSLLILFGATVVMLILDWRLALVSLFVFPLLHHALDPDRCAYAPGLEEGQRRGRDRHGLRARAIRRQHVVRGFGQEQRHLQGFKKTTRDAEGEFCNRSRSTSSWADGGVRDAPGHRGRARLQRPPGGARRARGGHGRHLHRLPAPGHDAAAAARLAVLLPTAGRDRAAGRSASCWMRPRTRDSCLGAQRPRSSPGRCRWMECPSPTSRTGGSSTTSTSRSHPGESVAFVGESGCGKSTLVKLAPGFYTPQRGRILIDGRDLQDLDLPSFRSQVGFVPQEAFLFPGSVAENIAWGEGGGQRRRSDSRRRGGRARRARSAAGPPRDTDRRGRHRPLGGPATGPGALRAMFIDPRVMILDEATSNIDVATETRVQAGTEHLMKGRTSIVIAHRLSTIKRADRIVVIDAGRIVEMGRRPSCGRAAATTPGSRASTSSSRARASYLATKRALRCTP